MERSLKYKYHLLLVLLFTDAGLGTTFGGELALRAGGRRQSEAVGAQGGVLGDGVV